MESIQITIKDIAKALGISISTVSRALKDHPDISKETRRIVQAYAKEHQYIPNSLALNLRTNSTHTIGVIIPELVHHFFSLVLAGIEEAANEAGYAVLICQSNEVYDKEVKNVEALLSSRVSGIIASISKNTTQYDHFKKIITQNIPLVFFDRICTGISTDRVVVDDYTGAFKATEHLIDMGCKRIAFYRASFNLEISRNRFNGYKDALTKHNLHYDPSLVIECDNREDAIKLTPEFLANDNPPDAVFCINDQTASGVLFIAKRLGIDVPNELSICGFSDGMISQACDPQLTSVEQHGRKVGRSAVELLIENINQKPGEIRKKKSRIITTSLIVRESTLRKQKQY